MSNCRFTVEQTVTPIMHLYARRPSTWEDGKSTGPWVFFVATYGPGVEPKEWIYLGEVPVTYTIPGGVDLLGAAIGTLEEQRKAVQAEAALKVKQIDKQIQALCLLEAPDHVP